MSLCKNKNLQSKNPKEGLLLQEEALLISDKNKDVERIEAKSAKNVKMIKRKVYSIMNAYPSGGLKRLEDSEPLWRIWRLCY